MRFLKPQVHAARVSLNFFLRCSITTKITYFCVKIKRLNAIIFFGCALMVKILSGASRIGGKKF